MDSIKIPIELTRRFFEKNAIVNTETSIDNIIDLIVTSPNGSFRADYNFGFAFQNTRFQNGDENDQIEEKKISGDSINKDSYASELKSAIEAYELRLKNIRVKMGYNPENKNVSLDISGMYEEGYSEKRYRKNITFYIW